MVTTSPPGIGLLKGLGVTVKFLFQRPTTQMYPKERPDLPPRTRGVIALMDENCTVCMLCARECPDWCIYIDSHKEKVPPAKEGGRARTRNVLDRFAIDFSLCMYCGICVEVCPFDALWWSPEFEYAEVEIGDLIHEMDRLREWMDTVPPPPPLDAGAEAPAEAAEAITKRMQELEAEAAKQQQADAPAVPAAAASAAAAPAAGAPAQAQVRVEGAGEIDQETFDQLIAEGSSERVARAKAKAAYVRKQKAKLQAEAEAGAAPSAESGGEAAAAAPEAQTAESAAPEPEASAQNVADVRVEGAGEIDQETFDRLIAEGSSERVARAKAKAAWVRKQKQAKLEEEGDA